MATATLTQYSATYRYFIIEDIDNNAIEHGFYFNGESTANTQLVGTGGPTTAGGALLPGNLVQIDTSSANLANPNVKRLAAASTTTIPNNVDLGVVYEANIFGYANLDNSVPNGKLVSVVQGSFVALMDLNSFVSGQVPNTIGQPIYAGVGANNSGLFSTTLSGTTSGSTVDLRLGVVKGFEVVTGFGGPGVQQGATYTSTSSSTPVLIGGTTVVRVAFTLPYVPKA